MPRFSYVGALLAVAALSSAPISAQKFAPISAQISAQKFAPISAQTPAPTSARVQHVVVRGTGAAMEVEIQTSGAPVAPDTQAITGPDRIVVDFPGALPAAELRALKVNRGALKGVRSGLFFSNPPITRIVLDLAEPQSYQISTTRISTTQNAIVVKLSPIKLSPVKLGQAELSPVTAGAKAPAAPAAPAARLQNASLAAGANVADTHVALGRVSTAVSNKTAALLRAVSAAPPPKPLVSVAFENGMLRIRTEKATLAQVLFEVQRQTQAEIAIPAGAEREEVAVDLGPAPARDVLAALLNGSPYNFIFVGNELSLERVILTRRDPSIF
jgi:AMIN domain